MILAQSTRRNNFSPFTAEQSNKHLTPVSHATRIPNAAVNNLRSALKTLSRDEMQRLATKCQRDQRPIKGKGLDSVADRAAYMTRT